ncbi:hypothetical protein U2F26_19665 [Micromonospora sp. 4G57]|uniref:Uncharacterized protein n=1 Tax=Micromonospora sicca TaxID=2202420 RepID=A0ABU5J5T3_9ACTN|nr:MULTISPECIES: hypothetical protein [unclassified Micromonospora]MDZ5444936.1 hypothetical protein [Micromonospora sp. 4G57]MDZ5487904.1 hypothetical protein [Micromonospora sp. 4G53]
MSWWRRRGAGAALLDAVLLIGAAPVARDVLRPGEEEISVEAYDRTDDPRVIVAHLHRDPAYVVSRVATAEDATSVVVRVSVRAPRLGWSGGDESVEWRIHVRLDQPLAGRQVIDGHTDAPVPER